MLVCLCLNLLCGLKRLNNSDLKSLELRKLHGLAVEKMLNLFSWAVQNFLLSILSQRILLNQNAVLAATFLIKKRFL